MLTGTKTESQPENNDAMMRGILDSSSNSKALKVKSSDAVIKMLIQSSALHHHQSLHRLRSDTQHRSRHQISNTANMQTAFLDLEMQKIICHTRNNNNNNEKALRRKLCALAVVRWSQNFSPRHRPLPGGAGLPKFNQLEMVTTFTYRHSLVKIDARNLELS